MRLPIRAAGLLLAIASLAACKKESSSTPTPTPNPTPTPVTPKRWVKTYRDVILYDDSAINGAQFLDTRNGMTYKMREVPDTLRKHLSLCYSVTQTGSYRYLSTTGSISSSASGPSSSLLWTGNPYGLNYWSAADLNTFEIRNAAYGSPELTAQEFDAIATSGDWNQFNAKYKEKNSGGEYIGFVSGSDGLGKQAYLGEINNALRMIIYVKSVSDNPTNGFVKLDIIVEGRTDAPSGAANVMPPM